MSREYVDALELRISSLESLLVRLKDSSNEERSALLDEIAFQDHLPQLEAKVLDEDTVLSEVLAKASLQETTEGRWLSYLTSYLDYENLTMHQDP